MDLSLYDNEFIGTIPPEISQLSKLESLYLDVNHFSGTIPTELAKIKHLDDLRLRHNDLIGTVPSELGLIEGLQILYLDRNQFTGTVPTQLGVLKYLVELHLYGNKLTGPIPSELSQLHALGESIGCIDTFDELIILLTYSILIVVVASLYLDNNHLTGGIPTEFGSMIDLGKRFQRLFCCLPGCSSYRIETLTPHLLASSQSTCTFIRITWMELYHLRLERCRIFVSTDECAHDADMLGFFSQNLYLLLQ